MRIYLLIALVVGVSSCAHGINLTVCVVDAVNSGYQCVDNKDGSQHFEAFANGQDLMCASPPDVEAFTKECSNHHLIELPVCSYQNGAFVYSPEKSLSPIEADNFVCLSSQSLKRLKERCK